MAVRVSCPSCRASASVEEQSLGRRGRCRKCGHVFTLAPGVGGPADLPERFGRYRILGMLGRGGMGTVYLAEDTRLGRRVALKVPTFPPSEGPQAVARFGREARAAATLDHPNLCPIHDVGEVDGTPYLTMPYIEGRPLSEAISGGEPWPEGRAVALVGKLALALAEAHDKGVVHRDLKPGNVMVNRRGEPVVMDFGLARVAVGDEGPLTSAGRVVGTALYMAPEQATGDPSAAGPASDVYGLGVILYELLAGRRPFEGPWSVVVGLKSVIDPEPPSTHRPGLDPALDAACLKAIAREPGARYPSMVAFAGALGGLPASSGGPADEAPGPAIRVDDGGGLLRPAPGGRRGRAVASGAVAALILGALGYAAGGLGGGRVAEVGPAPAGASGPVAKAGKPGPAVAPVDRRAEVIAGDGRWAVEGGELTLDAPDGGEHWLAFGDPSWTDYDFAFEARQDASVSGFRALFRSPDRSRACQFNDGWFNYKTALMEYTEGGLALRPILRDGRPARSEDGPPIEGGRWYSLRVEVRGGTARASRDGRPVLEVAGLPHARGRVGVGTGYSGPGRLRVRDIRVRSVGGLDLWAGPPEVPGDAAPGLSAAWRTGPGRPSSRRRRASGRRGPWPGSGG